MERESQSRSLVCSLPVSIESIVIASRSVILPGIHGKVLQNMTFLANFSRDNLWEMLKSLVRK